MTPEVRVREANSLALRMILWVGTIVMGAFMLIIFWPVIDEVMLAAGNTPAQGTAATTGRGWVRDMSTWLPLFMGLLLFVALLADAAREQRRI